MHHTYLFGRDALIDATTACTALVEFELRHPDHRDQKARVGHDPVRGVYAETVWNDVLVALDENDVDADRDPIVEIVGFLTNFGFIRPHALDDARRWRETPSCWRRNRPPATVGRVLTIIEALSAADG